MRQFTQPDLSTNHAERRIFTRADGEDPDGYFYRAETTGPPAREVLVNLDQIVMVQPGQGSGSAIVFGREHLVTFEEDVPTVIRRIQNGPYISVNKA